MTKPKRMHPTVLEVLREEGNDLLANLRHLERHAPRRPMRHAARRPRGAL